MKTMPLLAAIAAIASTLPAAFAVSPDSTPGDSQTQTSTTSTGKIHVTPKNKTVVKSPSHPGTTTSLNPQPLPPKSIRVRKATGVTHPGTTTSLNPQPLPPKDVHNYAHKVTTVAHPGTATSLNPQPLPPKSIHVRRTTGITRPGTTTSLNPQPLPPKETHSKTKATNSESAHTKAQD